jgi:hypothetical protein
MKPEKAKKHHLRHVILRAMGMSGNPAPDILKERFFPVSYFFFALTGSPIW